MVTVGTMFKNFEDLRRRLRGALRKSLAHEVGAGRSEGTSGSCLADGSESTDGQGDPENSEIVVVDLIPQACISDLVEPLELIETNGVAIRHQRSVEDDGQTRLAEGVHLLRFTEQL